MDKRPFYSDKYDAYEQHSGINITEQSDKNIRALKKRLTEKTLVPDSEKAQYGDNMLSEQEEKFFSFWMKTIRPLFTAKHGTVNLKKIQKAGALIPVADRRQFGKHKNSRTGGKARQGFNFSVLGIGDDHPVPLPGDPGILKLKIAKIPDSHKDLLVGSFIGPHLSDYEASSKYPPFLFGDTKAH